MRERTTWNREEVIAKAAALSKKADPYAMNNPEHLKAQPAADKYENGNPSSWAEDVADSKKSWGAEYSGGEVKRNEIGMPEMRSDTFNHAEKTASDAALDKKAAVCVSLSRKILPKTASESSIEDQAFAFMHMPDAMLVETFARLAAEDEKKEDEAKDEGQQKQAQQDEKKDESKDQGQKQAQEQDKKDEPKADEGQKKEAQEQDEKKDEQAKQATQTVSAADIQQMIQAGIQAALAQMQQQMPMAQQPQQAPAQAPAAATYSDDQMLDQLLAEGGAPMQDATAEMGIELDAPMMDVESSLGPEDAVLKTLFANDESKAQEEQEQAQGQGKQAGVRTASTRTVGTRPSAGVSRIGGAPAGSAAGGNDVERLSSMWASAPDVSDVFGTNRG